MSLSNQTREALRLQLCALQLYVIEAILSERAKRSTDQLALISEETAADTIYAIDRIAEESIDQWFRQNWPAQQPVEIIMEGIPDGEVLTYPRGTAIEATQLKIIIDPIDGTRGIMYDKRSAWILAGIAPQKGSANTLRDIEVAAMTEIPTTRHWRADQISAYRGGGLQSTQIDVCNDYHTTPIVLKPSQAAEVRHAFGTVCRFFPAGSTLLSQVEESLWARLYGNSNSPSPIIFNDQYISTGGQFYEILSGHDRFIADLRPLAFRKLKIESSNLACHPYDVACALLLEEAGCVIEHSGGQALDCLLDTTSPVEWVAYANRGLADRIRPVLQEVIAELL